MDANRQEQRLEIPYLSFFSETDKALSLKSGTNVFLPGTRLSSQPQMLIPLLKLGQLYLMVSTSFCFFVLFKL